MIKTTLVEKIEIAEIKNHEHFKVISERRQCEYILIKSGKPIYIGYSRNLRNRLAGHANLIKFFNITHVIAVYFNPKLFWVEGFIPNENSCRKLTEREQKLILELKPTHQNFYSEALKNPIHAI